ncbi:MAG TPA: hypothetical protein DCP38_14930 [Acidobacteria bacterium]|jgi:hypothetical protein|nr:hypothetical protein [Acidobacteriota bacterium]HAK56759.1 hypothetical protein [Acidobacteriota bacterium]|tara:strand:+ start:2789 stop:3766 length:978 start_codon:yes stop_codon:yes gene_type:complete
MAAGLCLLLAAAGCVSEEDAPAARVADSYRFALVGDMPYYADPGTQLPPEFVAAQYAAVLQEIDDADVEFVVHVGDTNSSRVCADSVYAERYAEFEALGHPVFYTPGDNEWLECDNAGLDPMEQLEHLRSTFTQGDESLGGRTLPLERQSSQSGYETFREHVRWRFGGDLYVALHVVGGGNNRGPDAEPRAEFVERNEAVIAWMRQSFELARQESLPSVVIVIHANPRWERFNRGEPNPSFSAFLEALHVEVDAFDGPVLLLHGDTHTFRVDKPISNPETGELLTNFTRVETFGHPRMHWVLITASSEDVDRFDVQPMIVSQTRP